MPSFSDIEIGDKIPPFTIKLDWAMYKKYNRFVHEINPLHFNEDYAKKLGFKGIVVAGVFTYNFFIRPLLNWTKDPTSIKKINIWYHKPAYIEDEITQGATITKKYTKNMSNYIECDIWVESQEKEKLASGSAIIVFKS
ncbi:MAG: MaoC family dehydratase [Promethearchaeota archaeon]